MDFQPDVLIHLFLKKKKKNVALNFLEWKEMEEINKNQRKNFKTFKLSTGFFFFSVYYKQEFSC